MLSLEQDAVSTASTDQKVFLYGPPGSGKTTAATAHLTHLVQLGIPGDQILVLVPQRTLGRPYTQLIRSQEFPAGGNVDVITIGSLAKRLIRLFWPVIARPAGFSKPTKPPIFLNLETAQYFMATLVQPLLDQGYFETIHLDRNRIFSQILDNLNKAAVVGFDQSQIGEKLSAAWIGKPEQTRAYWEAQDCANRFRAYCLENNLLDFSLQLEIFLKVLWPENLCQKYLFSTYRHLIYDNVEEDVPVMHDLIAQWLPHFDSALLIYDQHGGYRTFLGADPASGWQLQELCDAPVQFEKSFVMSPQIDEFRASFLSAFHREAATERIQIDAPAYQICRHSFHPQMIDWVAKEVADLVHQQRVPPGEITILSPFLSDALRFSLMERFEQLGVPSRSHRPSRSLREEPATHCLLTLAALAHPQWAAPVTHFDVRMALMQAIEGLDLTRADILAQIVFRPVRFAEGLASFSKIQPDTQMRITYQVGERYETLRDWLEEYRQSDGTELDIFLGRIFGEVLSQPGFGFHQSFDSASVAARLIESVQTFRWAAADFLNEIHQNIGSEYIRMVNEGVIAAQYIQPWQEPTQDAVFIAPAYTFLMANEPVRYQFWLDIGGMGWWERLQQPLTHPVVLTRHWPSGRIWTDADEYSTNQQTLDRLVSGLLRRCREKVYLCTSGVNERGEEPRGPLLQTLQTLLRRSTNTGGDNGLTA